jgi:hypothetical protein
LAGLSGAEEIAADALTQPARPIPIFPNESAAARTEVGAAAVFSADHLPSAEGASSRCHGRSCIQPSF